MYPKVLLVFLGLPIFVATQHTISFDQASSSSIFSPTFGAQIALKDSSGYWCSAGSHSPAQVVSWTGVLSTQRSLTGINIHWTYAPSEIKILGSVDGGNFEELLPWRKNLRSEPSFEESFQFPKSVNAKSVTVLMRGPMQWGYFGISTVTAFSDAFHFMLVSGLAGSTEMCLTTEGRNLVAASCLEAIVSGTGKEIFNFASTRELQTNSGKCLTLFGSSLSVSDCSLTGPTHWEATADGQIRQGKNCLAVLPNSKVAVRDCDEVAGTDEGKLFQVAVPEHNPLTSAAARSMATLLNNAVHRQKHLLAKLEKSRLKCKGSSLVLSQFSQSPGITLAKSNSSMTAEDAQLYGPDATIAKSIPVGLGLDLNGLSLVLSASRTALSSTL